MKDKIVLALKILAAIIAAILTVLGVTNCTTSLNIQKHNTNSKQKVEQSQSTSIDSTRVKVKFNNVEK